MNKNSRSKLIAAFLSVVMIVSLIPGMAFAANEYDVDIVLTKLDGALGKYNGQELIEVSFYVNPNSLNLSGPQSAVVVFTNSKFDPIALYNGAVMDLRQYILSKEKVNAAHTNELYFYRFYQDTSNPFDPIKVTPELVTRLDSEKDKFWMVSNADLNKAVTSNTPVKLLSYLVGLKSGVTFDDIKADDIRFATVEELADCSAAAAVSLSDGVDAKIAWRRLDGGADKLTAYTPTCEPDDTWSFAGGSQTPTVTEVAVPAADNTVFTYDGTAKTYTIAANDAYTVTGATETNAGTYTVTVALKNTTTHKWADGTTADKTYNFVINKAAASIAISGDLNVTEGTAVPDATVDSKVGDGAVTYYYYTNADCTQGETTTKPTAVGNYWVKAKIAASTNYEAAESNKLSFSIAAPADTRVSISASMITITGTYEYTGSAIEPTVVVNDGTRDLVKGTDYTMVVTNNVAAGTATVKVTGIGSDYKGEATATFEIARKALADADFELAYATKEYVGSELVPAVTTSLVATTDYTVEYRNNTYVGTASVIFTGAGNYTGEVTKTFGITAVDQAPSITATGSVIVGNTLDLSTFVGNAKGEVSFNVASGDATIDGTTLTAGTTEGEVKIDVAITAKDENNDGTDEYNAYTGTEAITVTISDKADAAVAISGTPATVTYGDADFELTATAATAGANENWTWTSSNDSILSVTGNGATATVTVVGAGSANISVEYTSDSSVGTASQAITVNAKDIADETIEAIADVEYDGTAKTPDVFVTGLTLDVDYEVAYSANTNAGIATVTVTGKGNYIGTNTATFNITAKGISAASIAAVENKVFTGSEIKPEPEVTDGSTVLVKGTDFEYSYANNTNAGDATITITGKGNYTGTAAATFVIEPKAIDDTMVGSLDAVSYTGSEFTPEPTVTGLVKDTDYTLSYADNTYVGTAAVTITGTGNYTGAVTKTFAIEAIAQAPVITPTATVSKGGNTIDLSTLVSDAMGDVTFSIASGSEYATLSGNVLTTLDAIGSVVIDIAISAKNVDGAGDDEYTAYTGTGAITVAVSDKADAAVTVANAPTTLTYGGADVTLTATAANTGDGAVWTWTSSDPAVLEVTNNNDGTATVKTLKSGSAVITAKYESNTTIGEFAIPAITVNKAVITVAAKPQVITVGGTAPDLTAPVEGTHYSVTGLAGTDTLDVTGLTMSYDATPDTTATGTYTITIAGATADADKYDVVFNNSTLTITNVSSGGGGGAPAYYNITFNTNGGSEVDKVQVKPNSVLSKPADPAKDGYTFAGWYTDKALKNPYNFTKKVSRGFTLYAKWVEGENVDVPDVNPVEPVDTSKLVLTIGKTEANVFGNEVTNDVAPVIVNDRTMLPIRFVAEALGATVGWDEATRTVSIKAEGIEISIVIDSEIATVNEEEITLDSAAFIQSDRTFVPLRFVAESLGANVAWDEATQTVTITK